MIWLQKLTQPTEAFSKNNNIILARQNGTTELLILQHVLFHSILVYGSMDTSAQCLLDLRNTMGSPVLSLKHASNFLFAGLWNGTLLIYERPPGGTCYIRLRILSDLNFSRSAHVYAAFTSVSHCFFFLTCQNLNLNFQVVHETHIFKEKHEKKKKSPGLEYKYGFK